MPVANDDEREFIEMTRRSPSEHLLRIYSVTGNTKSVDGIPYAMQSTVKMTAGMDVERESFVLSRADYRQLNDDLWLNNALAANGIINIPVSVYTNEVYDPDDVYEWDTYDDDNEDDT
jgi:hypothetical protein